MILFIFHMKRNIREKNRSGLDFFFDPLIESINHLSVLVVSDSQSKVEQGNILSPYFNADIRHFKKPLIVWENLMLILKYPTKCSFNFY